MSLDESRLRVMDDSVQRKTHEGFNKKIYACIVGWGFLKTDVILGGVYRPALRNATWDRGSLKSKQIA